MKDLFSIIPDPNDPNNKDEQAIEKNNSESKESKDILPMHDDSNLSDVMIGMSQILQKVAGELSDVKRSNVSVSDAVATMFGKVSSKAAF